MKILRKVFLAAIAMFAIAAASVSADTLIVKAESSRGETPTMFLLDYLESGTTVWLLNATGQSPVLYGGYFRNFKGGFSAEIAPGLVFDLEQEIKIQDTVLDLNFYLNRGRFALSTVNELGGILKQGPLTLFGDHEAVASLASWRIGLRAKNFFSPGSDSIRLGPVLGRQYGTVRVTLWPWRNVLESKDAGLLFQVKAVFSY